MTQGERIKQYCKDFGSITSMQAFMDLGVTQLATRIKELEEKGTLFDRETVKSKNRYGEPIHYTKYTLKKETEMKTDLNGNWTLF